MMKRILIAIAAFFICSQSVLAANCVTTAFAKTAGNWSGATTWVTVSGGSTNCTLVNGNAVVFDAGTGAGTYIMDAAFTIASLDASAVGAGVTLQQNVFIMTVSGNLFNLGALTYAPASATRGITFSDATAETVAITTSGHTLGNVILGSTGSSSSTFQFQDNINIRPDATLTLTSGTYNTLANNTFTGGGITSNNANTRTLTCGTGLYTINGTGVAPIDFTNLTGGTIQCTGTPFSFTSTALTARNLNLNGQTIGSLTISANATPSVLSFLQSFTVAGALTITGPHNIQLTAGTTITAGSFTGTGSSGSWINLYTTSTAGLTTNLAVGAASTCNYCVLKGVVGQTSAITATNSVDLGGNSGTLTITPPGGSRIIGG